MSPPSSRCEQCGAEMLPAMIRCRNCDWRRGISGELSTPVVRGQDDVRLPDMASEDDPRIQRMARELEELSRDEQPIAPDAQDSQETTELSPRRWTWRDLIPDIIYGLASDRTLAIIGAAIVGVGVIAGGLWWGPFSNADSVDPGLIISPGAVRGYITSLAIAENGTLAAGRTHGQVEIWDTTTRRLIETLSTVRGKYVALSRDGSRLLAGDEQQSCLVELTAGSVVVRDRGVRSISANVTGTHAVSLGTEMEILIWRLAADDPPARRPLATANVSAVGLSHDGRHFAVGTPTGRIRVLDVDRVKKVLRQIGIDGSGAITAMSLDATGERIAAITADNRLHVFKGQVYDKEWGPPLSSGITFVSKVHWLGEDQILIAGGRELAICSVHEKPQTWKADVHSIDALAVSPDGRMAAIGCRDESAIVLLDLTTRQRSGILDAGQE